MAQAKVQIRSHRFGTGTPAKLKEHPRLRQAMELFAEELRSAVGEAVFERIRSGGWHRSKNDRFGYYRTWSRYRYGSSRSRTRTGSRFQNRATKRLSDPDYEMPGGLDVRDTVEMLKYNFLVRALRKSAIRDGGRWTVQQHKRDRYGMSQLTGAYDITSALDKIDEIERSTEEIARSDGDPYVKLKQIEKHRRKSVSDFLHGSYDYNRFFKETKLGQRFLRSAEIAAMRYDRNDRLLDPNAEYNEELRRYEDTRKQPVNISSYQKIRGEMKAGRRGIPTIVPAGSFAWGYQTGTLARSWRDAKESLKKSTRGYTIRIAASEKRDGRNPSPLKLTTYLQRNIRRQGGNPALLTRQLAQQSVREALGRVKSRWAALGVRERGTS